MNKDVKKLIADLHQTGRLRVWSLVMTIMGDVVAPRGGVISMADLLAITEMLGIENGAVRTAMSRLSKEGWVKGQRQGRVSFYELGPKGLADYAPATQRIYALEPPYADSSWIIAILPTACDVAGPRPLLRRSTMAVWLAENAPTEQALADTDAMVFRAGLKTLPDWVLSEAGVGTFIDELNNITNKYTRLEHVSLSPEEALLTRILLIHDWRRLALRHPNLPVDFEPYFVAAGAARAKIGSIYGSLIKPSEAYWPIQTASGLETRFQP